MSPTPGTGGAWAHGEQGHPPPASLPGLTQSSELAAAKRWPVSCTEQAAPHPHGEEERKCVDVELGRSGYSSLDEAIHKSPTQHLVCFSEDKPQKFHFWGAGLCFCFKCLRKPQLGRPRGKGAEAESLEQAVTDRMKGRHSHQRQGEPLWAHPPGPRRRLGCRPCTWGCKTVRQPTSEGWWEIERLIKKVC